MTTIRLLASAGALCLLTLGAQAQTPSIEVSTDNESAQFAVLGQAQGVHVEVTDHGRRGGRHGGSQRQRADRAVGCRERRDRDERPRVEVDGQLEDSDHRRWRRHQVPGQHGSDDAAGYNNTTGEANAFFGAASGRANTTGQGNSFFDPNTGYFRTTGNYNSCFWTSASTAGETVNIPGKQSFGASTRQMLNLWDTSYGIGVQGSALYFRTDDNFAWFRDGVDHNTLNNPGAGGTILIRLDSAGNLFTRVAVNPLSDRNAKANFSSLDPRFILDKLAAVPIQTWSYKTDADSVLHLCPVAQDFRSAFRLGADDLHISTVDADGVALASIQALYRMMLEKDNQIERQGSQVAALARTVERQQAQLDQVRRAVRRKWPARR